MIWRNDRVPEFGLVRHLLAWIHILGKDSGCHFADPLLILMSTTTLLIISITTVKPAQIYPLTCKTVRNLCMKGYILECIVLMDVRRSLDARNLNSTRSADKLCTKIALPIFFVFFISMERGRSVYSIAEKKKIVAEAFSPSDLVKPTAHTDGHERPDVVEYRTR